MGAGRCHGVTQPNGKWRNRAAAEVAAGSMPVSIFNVLDQPIAGRSAEVIQLQRPGQPR